MSASEKEQVRNHLTHCGHGVSYKVRCPQCDLIIADNTVKSLGRMVDDARKLLADAGPAALKNAYGSKP